MTDLGTNPSCETCHWNENEPQYDAQACALCIIPPNGWCTEAHPTAGSNWKPKDAP